MTSHYLTLEGRTARRAGRGVNQELKKTPRKYPLWVLEKRRPPEQIQVELDGVRAQREEERERRRPRRRNGMFITKGTGK